MQDGNNMNYLDIGHNNPNVLLYCIRDVDIEIYDNIEDHGDIQNVDETRVQGRIDLDDNVGSIASEFDIKTEDIDLIISTFPEIKFYVFTNMELGVKVQEYYKKICGYV